MKKRKPSIKRMSYQERQAHYEQEKQEMYYKNMSLPADELERLRDELIEKWGV